MLSSENHDTATGVKKHRHHCALRMVGRAGLQSAGSRRRTALLDGALHCSSAAPVSRHAATRKLAAHRTRSESSLPKDTQLDSWMSSFSSDHAYLAKPNQRRSSLPMDYRWLAGMKPKWYAKVKEQRSVLKQHRRSVLKQQDAIGAVKHLELANLDNELTVCNSTGMSPTWPQGVVRSKASGHYDKTVSPYTHCLEMYQSAGVHSHPYSAEKFICTEREAVLTPVEQWSDPMLLSDCHEVAVISHEDRQLLPVKEHVDKQILCSTGHCTVDKSKEASELFNTSDTMFKSAVCCSSRCDCFCFCDSSIECETDPVPKTEVDVVGLITNAAYIGCNGSCKVTCDLHVVGAQETVSDRLKSATCVTDGRLNSAADNSEHEDFVDNVCIDCGCELTVEDMAECVYSVPICSICLQDANHNVPSVDDIVSADHGYTSLSVDTLLCPSPQKETSLTPSVVRQQADMPDIDVVDNITFLSFPSKLLMHKYISCQQNNCEPAIKSSWMKLARCERSWHGGHKSHRSVWFGSSRHRHIDRFTAHSRLNEQIELGLLTPVSAQNSSDLRGIKLEPCLSQNSSDKSAVGRKLKYRNRHVPNDSIQRPTRVAARGQHYCLTRFRRKGNGLRTLADGERVVTMKLTQHQAEEALELLHVPSIITRNSCSQPGIFCILFYLPVNALKFVVVYIRIVDMNAAINAIYCHVQHYLYSEDVSST